MEISLDLPGCRRNSPPEFPENVAADVRFLEQAGLIDTKKETSKEISPHVTYDKILLEITV